MHHWLTLLSANRPGQNQFFATGQSRSAFEQDYDRIIFSHPFRRLQDKTQVHPLPKHDFVHTRLTHSLEVSSVGRSLGRLAGEVIIQRHPELKSDFTIVDFGAIVAAAALAHDIGNPPFGHAGENAISDFFKEHAVGKEFHQRVNENQWEDLCKFEGNAQGFRLLNKNQYGLKLTMATLGAFTKYPCPSLFKGRDKTKKSQKKFGYFESEKTIFESVASSLGLLKEGDGWKRHPLAFLVEAADDVCYSIIDLEDGCSLGLVSFEEARNLFEGVITFSKSKLGKLEQLAGKEEKIGYLRALAIADLTHELSALFLDHETDIVSGKFDQALADVCSSSEALQHIIKISVEKIYKARHVLEIEASGHEVLPGLLEEFVKAGQFIQKPTSSRKYENLSLLLPPSTQAAIKTRPDDDYHMLREIIDFVSGLTDKNAIALFRQIKGIG